MNQNRSIGAIGIAFLVALAVMACSFPRFAFAGDPVREANLRDEIDRNQDQVQDLVSQVVSQQRYIDDLEYQIAQLANEYDNLQPSIPPLQSAMEKARAVVTPVQRDLDEAQLAVQTAEQRIAAVTDRLMAAVESDPMMNEARQAHHVALRREKIVFEAVVEALRQTDAYFDVSRRLKDACEAMQRINDSDDIDPDARQDAAVLVFRFSDAARKMEEEALAADVDFPRLHAESDAAFHIIADVRRQLVDAVHRHPDVLAARQDLTNRHDRVAAVQDRLAPLADACRAAAQAYNAVMNESDQLKSLAALRASQRNAAVSQLSYLNNQLNYRQAAIQNLQIAIVIERSRPDPDDGHRRRRR